MTEKRGPFYLETPLKQQGLSNFLNSKSATYSSFSGTDIQAIMYLPLLTRGTVTETNKKKIQVFADLQTLSISSTRSVSPVRVLGRASPIAWTRGARTYAGTMVFASISHDPFGEVYDVAMAESYMSSSNSMVSDQLPPFSVVITAANELGNIGITAIHGITLVNYGTTYSIDDLYTETVYGFVADEVIPLTTDNMAARKAITSNIAQSFSSVTRLVEDSMSKAYGTMGNLASEIMDRYTRQNPRGAGEEFSNGIPGSRYKRYQNG